MSVDVADPGTDLVVANPTELLDHAEEMFPPERRKQIAQFLALDHEHPAFLPFLAISASLGLNPLLGEIWCIPQNVRERIDGTWRTTGVRYQAAVGRDGFLRKAKESPAFSGIKSDVVCANDVFRVVHHTEDATTPPTIIHEYAPKLPGKDARRSRGAVIGAWAILYLKGRPPVYYFADAAEHAKTVEKDGRTSWHGAWSYTSAMILKSAVSYVCRIGVGVTGVLPADEMVFAPSLEDVRRGALLPGDGEGADDDGVRRIEDIWIDVAERAGEDVAASLSARFADRSAAEIEMTLAGLEGDALRELSGVVETSDRAERGNAREEREDPGQAESATPVGEPPPDDEPDEVIALRRRRDEVLAAIPEDDSEVEAELRAEVAQIDEQLARIAGEDPAQEQLL